MWRALILACLVCGACDGDKGPTTPPADPAPPVVDVTTAFADSPVAGVVSIVPVEQLDWSYEVDLDDDGQPDAAGTVDGSVQVPYVFEIVGPHRILVTLRRDTEEELVERFVIVNDPTAIEVLGTETLADGHLEGIAVTNDDTMVIVADAARRRLFALDSVTLEVMDTIEVAAENTIEGLAIPSDEELLYVIDKRFVLRAFALPTFELLGEFSTDGAGEFFVEALPDRRAYVGGNDLGLVDLDGATVERRVEIDGGFHFAVSPDGDAIAVALMSQSVSGNTTQLPGVVLLNAGDFSEIWRTELEAAVPEGYSVAFSPGGERIYLLLSGGFAFAWHLLILAAETGEILRNMLLGVGCAGPCTPGAANPVAVTHDGRFVVFSTHIGAFFVDTATHLPAFRTVDSPGLFCCNVAASPSRDVIYFPSEGDGTITKIRLTR